MSKNRPSCIPGLEKKLRNEVGNICPICGSGGPLVMAHTVKDYPQVGWNADYLLAICDECEEKHNREEIKSSLLGEIKRKTRLFIPNSSSVRPYYIPYRVSDSIYLGNTFIKNTKIIFEYRSYRILWLEVGSDGSRKLNARLYDKNGTVVTAIDRNQWTAEKEKFFEIEIVRKDEGTDFRLKSKVNDTELYLSFYPDKFQINKSIFYIPDHRVEILEDGTTKIDSSTFCSCQFVSCGVAFHFG